MREYQIHSFLRKLSGGELWENGIFKVILNIKNTTDNNTEHCLLVIVYGKQVSDQRKIVDTSD